jgi:hypothetical protein
MKESRMERLDTLSVSVNGLMAELASLLKSWKPGTHRTEKEYSDELAEFLRGAVPADAKVEREYRHHGTTMDLYLKWTGLLSETEVFFEVKKDLKKKTDFDRLVGQIEGLDPAHHRVVVVLFGNSSPQLIGRLKEKYEEALADTLTQPQLLLVDKNPNQAPEEEGGWLFSK